MRVRIPSILAASAILSALAGPGTAVGGEILQASDPDDRATVWTAVADLPAGWVAVRTRHDDGARARLRSRAGQIRVTLRSQARAAVTADLLPPGGRVEELRATTQVIRDADDRIRAIVVAPALPRTAPGDQLPPATFVLTVADGAGTAPVQAAAAAIAATARAYLGTVDPRNPHTDRAATQIAARVRARLTRQRHTILSYVDDTDRIVEHVDEPGRYWEQWTNGRLSAVQIGTRARFHDPEGDCWFTAEVPRLWRLGSFVAPTEGFALRFEPVRWHKAAPVVTASETTTIGRVSTSFEVGDAGLPISIDGEIDLAYGRPFRHRRLPRLTCSDTPLQRGAIRRLAGRR